MNAFSGYLGCSDIAQAIRDLMTVANFSGTIRQVEGEPLRQFSVSSIEGDNDKALIRFNFAGQGFVLDISPDTNASVSEG